MPKLIHGDNWTARTLMRFTPGVDRLFRPEEEHGRSRVKDVIPPMRGGHGEMGDVRERDRLLVLYFER